MVKLTAIHYKVKSEALKICHSVDEEFSKRMFEWEKEMGVSTVYIEKPFMETFQFETFDYVQEQRPLRINKKDVMFYKLNIDNVTEITIKEDITFTVIETIEELDKIFLHN